MKGIKPLIGFSLLLACFTILPQLTQAATWSASDQQMYKSNCIKGANKRMDEYMKANKNNPEMNKKLLRVRDASVAMCSCVMNEVMKKWSLSELKTAGKAYFEYIRKVAGPNQACDARKFIKK